MSFGWWYCNSLVMFKLLLNWPNNKIWSPEDFLCDEDNQCIGSLFLSCRIIPHHKQLQGAKVLFCSMSSWRSINSAFEMTVQEVLLCCSASILYKGYSVWVQNSISYHLTGCSWILFPTQQGSHAVPELHSVRIRPVLPVPGLPSGPARDGCSLRSGELGTGSTHKAARAGDSPTRAPSCSPQVGQVWRW